MSNRKHLTPSEVERLLEVTLQERIQNAIIV